MFLELKNTNIGYKAPLIKGVSTGMDLGEICLLIGNNGVGKTTLIKSILNQIPVLKNEIFLNQQNLKNLSSKQIAEQIAVVFSKSQIPSNYTLVDLISLGKYIHYPYYFELNYSDKQHVEEIIERLNLSQYRKLQLSELSDGNLQKAFIGRALAQNSPMIILDEPTTHLDEENKIAILKILRSLAKEQKKVILFSSHDWRLAKEFTDKIWYIKERKLFSGITEDVLHHHSELTDPSVFGINASFVPPQISAPNLEKELMFSLLQKNIQKDLSNFSFIYDDGIWVISSDNFHQKASSFTDVIKIVENLH